MATLASAQFDNRLVVNQTLSLETGLNGKTVVSQRFNRGGTNYGPAGTPPVEHYYGRRLTLVAASMTLDLTALADDENVAFSALGQRLQLVRVHHRAANAGQLTISGGDSHPYEPFGAGRSLVIPVGGELCLRASDTLPEVSSGAKTLKLSGTVGDVIDLEMLLG